MNGLLGRNKGISPLIASVLLIAFTMSVAVLFTPWATNMVQSVQEDTSEDAKSLATASNMRIRLTSASFNHSTRNLSVVVQNDGEESFGNFSITVQGDKPYNQKFSKSLKPKEITPVEMYAGDPFNMEKISASLTRYPVSAERVVDGVPAENHLRGYWPMDSGSGIYANDSIDSNDGVLRNGSTACSGGLCPNRGDGVYGGAVRFDGIDDNIKVENDPYLNPENAITISLWIYRNSTGTPNPRIISKTGWNNQYSLLDDGDYIDGDNSMSFNLADSGGVNHQIDESNSIPLKEWTHYTAVYPYKENKMSLFRNGRQVASKNIGDIRINQRNGILSIGRNTGSNDEVNGTIDEVKIWDTGIRPKRIRDPVVLE